MLFFAFQFDSGFDSGPDLFKGALLRLAVHELVIVANDIGSYQKQTIGNDLKMKDNISKFCRRQT